jgi:hypothetical protein
MTTASRGGLPSYLFIAAAVIVWLAAAWAWYVTSVDYQAYALLKVASVPPAVLERPAQGSPEQFSIFKRTQVQLIQSPLVLAGAVRDPSIQGLSLVQAHRDDAVSWLKGHLTIDYPDDAEIMRVSLTGSHPRELAAIVDKIVAVYFDEVVNLDKQQRIANEEKLRRAYERQIGDYEKELQALRVLESIHKTSGSEQAELKKRLATEELDAAVAQRVTISEEIRRLDVEIAVAKDRAAAASREVRTAKLAVAEEPQATQSLADLLRKKEVLQQQLEAAEKLVKSKTEEVAGLESFSSQVATKQEELDALRQIKNRLAAELDRTLVERLAPERITLVHKAVLDDSRGNALRRNVTCGALAALGLVLAGMGVLLRLPGG